MSSPSAGTAEMPPRIRRPPLLWRLWRRLLLRGSPSFGQEVKTGPIELAEGRQAATHVDVGRAVRSRARISVHEIHGQKTIGIESDLDCSGPGRWMLHAAFFDSEGYLLACGSIGGNVESSTPSSTRFELDIELPPEWLPRVASYQIVHYEGPARSST